MKYNSICSICGRQTPLEDDLIKHLEMKRKMGFVELQIHYINDNFGIRSLNFCQSCAKKSYTIEDLKTVGNYNEWSY